MSDDSQILISRLLTHQTLRRDDRLVKRALSDEQFRVEVDQRLLACGMRLLDNVYADHVTLALTREIEPKVFGAKDVWQNNNFGLARDGVALLVVLWAQIILPKRERQETHQHADDDQNDMFGVDKPLPRAEDTSIGIPYKALLADFGDKLGRKTRMDMNLGILSKLGFIERRGEVIFEGPLLDLVMDTDLLKERIVNGALADVFKRRPTQVVHIPRAALAEAAAAAAAENAAAEAAAIESAAAEEAAQAVQAARDVAVAEAPVAEAAAAIEAPDAAAVADAAPATDVAGAVEAAPSAGDVSATDAAPAEMPLPAAAVERAVEEAAVPGVEDAPAALAAEAPIEQPVQAAKPAKAPREPKAQKASKEQKDDELPPGVNPAWPFEQFKRD